MKKNTTYRLVVSAILIALATILNEVATFESPFLQGGGVTIFSQVPVIALGYIFGVPWGLASGFVFSCIQILFGLGNFAYVKGFGAYLILVVFDYVLPYTLLGLGGIFKNKIKNQYAALSIGTVMVCVIRFLCHFISGATIWADWTDGAAMGPILAYSATYNAGYMIPETIITVIGILALLKFFFPRLDENGMLKTGKGA